MRVESTLLISLCISIMIVLISFDLQVKSTHQPIIFDTTKERVLAVSTFSEPKVEFTDTTKNVEGLSYSLEEINKIQTISEKLILGSLGYHYFIVEIGTHNIIYLGEYYGEVTFNIEGEELYIYVLDGLKTQVYKVDSSLSLVMTLYGFKIEIVGNQNYLINGKGSMFTIKNSSLEGRVTQDAYINIEN